MGILKLALAAAAGGLAGVANAMAGGGTLITYPSLLLLGHGPIAANTTSTLALWPGYVAASFGFRPNLAGTRRVALILAWPSLAGGLTGALLLLTTPAHLFQAVVPGLVFGATLLLAWQGRSVERPAAPSLAGGRLAGARPVPLAGGGLRRGPRAGGRGSATLNRPWLPSVTSVGRGCSSACRSPTRTAAPPSGGTRTCSA